jgi:4-aminobutyrate aminotransferase-like enzyme
MAGPTSYFDPANAGELDSRTRDLIQRRARVLGPAYRLFYEHPVEFVRGTGTHLFDADGNDYLDVYNNVPSVGHSHPRVVAAIAEQAATLNTHTRYLQEGIISYAEDLLSALPASISNIMFTCTGSEANDLALRIAKSVTGNTGVIVTANGYHGVTTETAAISPSLGGVESVAPWVEVIAAPDPYRDAAGMGEEVRAAIARLEARGIHPAALIVDTIFASDGVLPVAPGFADAVAAVRAAGGLFIADEVQPGFGRLGTGMWGFERHGAGGSGLAPDLVTVGKPMGNGHPIAAVLARPELIEEFGRRMRYFNTFGGNPVAIAAARATLDVIRDEALIENSHLVGDYLRAGIETIAERFEAIGDVRGSGLFIGVELVTDRNTRSPNEPLALAVVNGLRERRVLLSASGPHNNVLKVRPPLPFSIRDADRFLTELDAVLATVAR